MSAKAFITLALHEAESGLATLDAVSTLKEEPVKYATSAVRSLCLTLIAYTSKLQLCILSLFQVVLFII